MMKNKKYKEVFKNGFIFLGVFFVGFIGSILLINKKVNDTLSLFMDQMAQESQKVSIFGWNVVEFVSTESNGIRNIDVIKTQLYNYIPFIVGLLLVLLSVILTFLVKKYVNHTGTKTKGDI